MFAKSSLKRKILYSFLYANIFCNPYFYLMVEFEILYKNFFSLLLSYSFLILLLTPIFFFFFKILNFFQNKYSSFDFFEFFSILFSLIVFKSIVYTSHFPSVSFFFQKYGIGLNNLISKITVTLSIIIIFFLISAFFKLFKKKLFDFFAVYSLFLVLIIFYSYFFDKPRLFIVNKNEVSTALYKNNSVPNKRVLFVILDEFDNEIALKEKLINFELLKKNSVFGDSFFSPGPSTTRSLPSYLTGKKNFNPIASSRKREIYLSKDNQIIKLNYENSIFNKLNNGDKNSIILAGPLPLCFYFKKIECIDDMSFIYSANIFFATKLLINDILNKLKFNYKIDLSYIGNFRPDNQITHLSRVVKKFDKNFAFIHLHLPHMPQDFKSTDILKIYKKNLKKADLVIKKIIEDLNDTPTNQEYLLIITSDHWLGQLSSQEKPVPFILKLKSDNDNIEIKSRNETLSSFEIIQKFLNNEINSHKDLVSFINNYKS